MIIGRQARWGGRYGKTIGCRRVTCLGCTEEDRKTKQDRKKHGRGKERWRGAGQKI